MTVGSYDRCATLIDRVGGTHYKAQLGLPEKGRANKGCIIKGLFDWKTDKNKNVPLSFTSGSALSI